MLAVAALTACAKPRAGQGGQSAQGEPSGQGEPGAEGVQMAVGDQGWACVDGNGKVLLTPFLVDNGPDDASEGLFRYVADGKVGFATPACVPAVAAAYDGALPFSEGRAAVCEGCREIVDASGEHHTLEGGMWGYIDATGAVIIPLQFQAAESFAAGQAWVQKDGQRVAIDLQGQPKAR